MMTEIKDTTTEIRKKKNTLEEISSRLSDTGELIQQSGRQSTGNYLILTEKSKKKLKEMMIAKRPLTQHQAY